MLKTPGLPEDVPPLSQEPSVLTIWWWTSLCPPGVNDHPPESKNLLDRGGTSSMREVQLPSPEALKMDGP